MAISGVCITLTYLCQPTKQLYSEISGTGLTKKQWLNSLLNMAV
jgi:hypothetical protein